MNCDFVARPVILRVKCQAASHLLERRATAVCVTRAQRPALVTLDIFAILLDECHLVSDVSR